MPYYGDLELEIPVDYVEDYTVEERLGTSGRQQPLQNKKVPQDLSTLSGNNGVFFIIYSIILFHSKYNIKFTLQTH